MALHYKIELWEDQKWYPKIIKAISYWVQKTGHFKHEGYVNDRVYNLPDEYKMDKSETKVLLFTPGKSIKSYLDKENKNIKINNCAFEVHLKGNKIEQIYLPL